MVDCRRPTVTYIARSHLPPSSEDYIITSSFIEVRMDRLCCYVQTAIWCSVSHLYVSMAKLIAQIYILYVYILHVYILYVYILYVYILYVYILYVYILYVYILYVYILYVYILYVYILYVYILYVYILYVYILYVSKRRD